MWIHKYSLRAKDPLNSASTSSHRQGFFVKDSAFKANDDPIKNFLQFSDFMHWPELGDPDFNQLKPFLMASAQKELDSKFSLEDKDLVPVKSNALVNNFSSSLGEDLEKLKESSFEVIKLKMGREFEKQFKSLMRVNLSHFLVRVDLNNKFNFKESKEVLEMLKKIPNLEYIEDPTPYHDYYWSELQKLTPLALDDLSPSTEIKKPEHFQYRIVKPIRGFDIDALTKMTYEKKKIVLTNMMDSVVGAWKLYFYHCELKKRFPYHLGTPGFYTHSLFENYDWNQWLSFTGALWTYDSQKLTELSNELTKLEWLELNYLDTSNLDKILQKAGTF